MRQIVIAIFCLTMSGCMLDLLIERDGKQTSVEIDRSEKVEEMSENQVVSRVSIRAAYDPRQPRHINQLMFVDENGEPEVTKTVQSEKDRVEVNNIIRRYNKTGLVDHVAKGKAMYGDFTEVNEYRENLDMVKKAQDSFAGLPSEIRKKFDNDPGKFFEFATNPENADALVEMGLAHVEKPPAPQKVQIVNQEPKGDKEASKDA